MSIQDYDYDYEYEESSDKSYCYPNTNILKNKFDIRDIDVLHEAEREYSMVRYAELEKRGVTGRFDLNHLRAIHKYLFQDVYEWAGEIRTVDISKGNIFCLSQFILPQFDNLYKELKRDKLLMNISDKHKMSQKLAYYLAEINAIHPFREGNGRTQRMYCEQLCLGNGRFYLDFSEISSEEMLRASVESFEKRDYRLMEQIVFKCLKEE